MPQADSTIIDHVTGNMQKHNQSVVEVIRDDDLSLLCLHSTNGLNQVRK